MHIRTTVVYVAHQISMLLLMVMVEIKKSQAGQYLFILCDRFTS